METIATSTTRNGEPTTTTTVEIQIGKGGQAAAEHKLNTATHVAI